MLFHRMLLFAAFLLFLFFSSSSASSVSVSVSVDLDDSATPVKPRSFPLAQPHPDSEDAVELNSAASPPSPSPRPSVFGSLLSSVKSQAKRVTANSPADKAGKYIESLFGRTSSTGAASVRHGDNTINPYFANLALQGYLQTSLPNRFTNTLKWLKWFSENQITTNSESATTGFKPGAIYDFEIQGGQSRSKGDADSADSYPATFISLAYQLIQTAQQNPSEPGAASVSAALKQIQRNLFLAAKSLVDSAEPSKGYLTNAKPKYAIAYLMDNCEVYRGLKDFATLSTALYGSAPPSAEWRSLARESDRLAELIKKTILTSLWVKNAELFKTHFENPKPGDLNNWYPGATAQVYPVVFGVIEPSHPIAQKMWNKLKSVWPTWWPNRVSNTWPDKGGFPWCIMAHAAALMGDHTAARSHVDTAMQAFPGFRWPFHSMEAGFLIKALKVLERNGK